MKTTIPNSKKFSEFFKQQAIISAQNLFTSVTEALKNSPELKQTIIMKQIPRYDPIVKDPSSLKPALSQLFNDTLTKLWLESPLKHRITLGSHSLECHGGIRESRYRNGGKFDGIHLYGPSGKKAYTESVLSIIKNAGIAKNSPPKYFRRFHQEAIKSKIENNYFCPTQDTDYLNDKDVRTYAQAVRGPAYSVPTSNRFSGFSQGNY